MRVNSFNNSLSINNNKRNNKSFGMKEVNIGELEGVSSKTVRLIDEALDGFYQMGDHKSNLDIRAIKISNGDKISFDLTVPGGMAGAAKRKMYHTAIVSTEKTVTGDLLDAVRDIIPGEIQKQISKLRKRAVELGKKVSNIANQADLVPDEQYGKFTVIKGQGVTAGENLPPSLPLLASHDEKLKEVLPNSENVKGLTQGISPSLENPPAPQFKGFLPPPLTAPQQVIPSSYPRQRTMGGFAAIPNSPKPAKASNIAEIPENIIFHDTGEFYQRTGGMMLPRGLD